MTAKRYPLWWRRAIAALTPRRTIVVVKGDSLPTKLPIWNLILVRDDGEDWSVGLRCPCGCGQRLEMMVLKEARPRWDISLNRAGHVSLHPSVWLRNGCRSHFWIKEGKVIWCD